MLTSQKINHRSTMQENRLGTTTSQPNFKSRNSSNKSNDKKLFIGYKEYCNLGQLPSYTAVTNNNNNIDINQIHLRSGNNSAQVKSQMTTSYRRGSFQSDHMKSSDISIDKVNAIANKRHQGSTKLKLSKIIDINQNRMNLQQNQFKGYVEQKSIDRVKTLLDESDEALNPLLKYENPKIDSFKAYYKANANSVIEQVDYYNKIHSNIANVQQKTNLSRLQDINTPSNTLHTFQKSTPSIMFNLTQKYNEKNDTLPRRFKIQQKLATGPVDLELKNYFIGKKHAEVLGELIHSRTDMFRSVNLQNSNMNSYTSETFLTNLKKQTPQMLNLSHNRIGLKSCGILGSILNNRKQVLKELNLEGAKIGTLAALELVKNLVDNRSVKILNLSDNNLDDLFALNFKKILEQNENLEELYLHWNQFRSQGGAHILEGVTAREWVKVLDLSWNKLGSGSKDIKGQGLDSICKCLIKQKKSIVHLDLSFNQFSLNESTIIQNAIKDNKSLVGFHFNGNYGYVDMQGFLQIPADYKEYSKLTMKPPHRIVGSKPVPIQTKQLFASNSKYRDNCWICDNWQEQAFTWPIFKDDQDTIDSILIHLSFESFKAVEIQANKQLSHYELIRMCPPSRVWFFFTINRQQKFSNLYNLGSWPEKEVRNVQIGNKLVPLMIMDEMNFIDISPVKAVLDDDFDALFDVQLRVDDKMFEYSDNDGYESDEVDSQKLQKSISSDDSNLELQELKSSNRKLKKSRLPVVDSKWKISNSIFKDYKRDTDSTLKAAFEFDWKNSKLSQLRQIQQDVDKFKCSLLVYYQVIKDIFRYLSAFSVQSNVYVVTGSCFLDFTQCFNLQHITNLKPQQVELRYLETTTKIIEPSTKQEPQLQAQQSTLSVLSLQTNPSQIAVQNPILYQQISNAKGLTRRGFLECTVRVILERYYRQGESKSPSAAIEDAMRYNIYPCFKGFECDSWRHKRYWNSYCERVIKKHWHELQQLYIRYSGSKIKSFTPYKCLFLEEFKQIWIEGGPLVQLSDRELTLCFSLSQVTHQNEIDSDRYLFLNFIEFIEAIARVADRINLPPVFSTKEVQKQINCAFLPLCFKLESLIIQVSTTILGTIYDANNPLNKKNILDFGKYHESMLEQILWRKVTNQAERRAKRIQDKQCNSVIKTKLKKSFLLELMFDDGMGLFKNTQSKLQNLISQDDMSEISQEEIADYEPSF